MSLDPGAQASIIWGGIATLLVLGGAIFKAAKLRGQLHSEWCSRVDLAVASLDEKTVAELGQLRDQIDAFLPEKMAPFDPAQTITDPAAMTVRVERSTKYFKARVKMENSLVRVRLVGHALLFGLLFEVVAVILLTLHYSEIVSGVDWLRWPGFALAGVGGVVLIVAMCVFVVCETRLSRGEILAGTSGQSQEAMAHDS